MREDFGKRLAQIIGQDEVDQLKIEATIAAQIIQARHARKMSQQQLADAIGAAKSTIVRIEGGLMSPTVSTLYKIAEVLGVRFVIDPKADHGALVKS